MNYKLVGIGRRSFQDKANGQWVDMTTLHVVCEGTEEEGLVGDMVGCYTIMHDRCEGLRLGAVELSFSPTRDGKMRVSGVKNIANPVGVQKAG